MKLICTLNAQQHDDTLAYPLQYVEGEALVRDTIWSSTRVKVIVTSQVIVDLFKQLFLHEHKQQQIDGMHFYDRLKYCSKTLYNWSRGIASVGE